MSATTELPMYFRSDKWVDWFLDHDPTADDLHTAFARVGRVEAVGLLVDLFNEGVFLFNSTALAAVVGDVWSMSEFPDTHLEHDAWRAMFDAAGYTEDGVITDRPSESVRLWRGSVAERRDDWSWTDNRDVAARYASGDWYRRPTGTVWTALVEPSRLLARNTGRGEHEYVVDARGLAIVDDTKPGPR